MDERAKITGPIELSGYTTLNLFEHHQAILPNGETFELPAGTKLVMVRTVEGGGGSLKYEGAAAKAQHPRPAPIEA